MTDSALSDDEFRQMIEFLRRFAGTDLDQFAQWRIPFGEDKFVYVEIGLTSDYPEQFEPLQEPDCASEESHLPDEEH